MLNCVVVALKFLHSGRRPTPDFVALRTHPSQWHLGMYHRLGMFVSSWCHTGVEGNDFRSGRKGPTLVDQLPRGSKLQSLRMATFRWVVMGKHVKKTKGEGRLRNNCFRGSQKNWKRKPVENVRKPDETQRKRRSGGGRVKITKNRYERSMS